MLSFLTQLRASPKNNEASSSVRDKDDTKDRLQKEGLSLYGGGAVGHGSHSKVRRGYSKRLQKDVAVKIVNRSKSPTDFREKFLPRELDIILRLKHDYIVTYHSVYDLGSKVFILMDYLPRGDLLEHIRTNKYVEENLARTMFQKVCLALQYLHSNDIIHRDLKCENILLDDSLEPKLTDFGFAKIVADEQRTLNSTFCGSAAYASPEILKGIPYDGDAADVWSLGVILFVMVTGLMPFDDSNPSKLLHQIKRGPSFARSRQQISEEVMELITSILDYSAVTRPSLKTIQSSEWLL